MNDRQRVQLMTGLMDVATKVASGAISRKTAAQRLRSAAKWLEQGEQGRLDVGTSDPEVKPDVQAIFDHWVKATRRNPKTAKFTRLRRGIITGRLADGFSAADLRAVISWAAESPFHQGDNDRGQRYDRLENIMRSHEKCEANLERARDDRRATTGALDGDDTMREQIERLERQAREALNDGDVERYNGLQEHIRKLSATGPRTRRSSARQRGTEPG